MKHQETDFDERTFEVIAGGSAVSTLVAFTLVGEFGLENLAYGAIAGVFTGIGSYLFLSWFLAVQASQETSPEEISFSEAARDTDRSSQLGALGLGLDLGGIVMLAVGFALAEPDLIVGTGAAVAVILLVSLVGSVLFDR